jgi:seryl-tRNA synthetase
MNRTEYRALKKHIDSVDVIVGIEKNSVDPAATKLNYQEKLRSDKQYLDLLKHFREKGAVLIEKCKAKNAKYSRVVRVLNSEIEELKKKIQKRAIEIRESSVVFALVPAEYVPMEQSEANEVIYLLRGLKKGEQLGVDKRIIKEQKNG